VKWRARYTRGVAEGGRDWRDIVFPIIIVVVVVGFLATAAIRAADIYYKAAWIVTHFPPKSDLCIAPFCVRTDTQPSMGTDGALFGFHHCPDHANTEVRGGRDLVVFGLWCFAVALVSLLMIPILGAVFRLAMWPILIPMRLAGQLPPGRLLPFRYLKDEDWEPWASLWHDRIENIGMVVGVIVALVSWVVFLWW